MLAVFNVGITGLTPGYTLLNEDKTVYQSRTQTGVTELVSGSGVYGVALSNSLVGKIITWDIGAGSLGAGETLTLPPDNTSITAIKTTTDKLDSMLEQIT